jgi:hypothetical protein
MSSSNRVQSAIRDMLSAPQGFSTRLKIFSPLSNDKSAKDKLSIIGLAIHFAENSEISDEKKQTALKVLSSLVDSPLRADYEHAEYTKLMSLLEQRALGNS